ncbi:MAG: nucleoside monophosphate kinase, partial [Anaerolineae bacterium]|nr:nucleoside monophosphate kinase [Gemmatimonadaceae bacterium]
MNILLLGPPGAGKGTQGERISDRLGIPVLATGNVLRNAVRNGTDQGLAAK